MTLPAVLLLACVGRGEPEKGVPDALDTGATATAAADSDTPTGTEDTVPGDTACTPPTDTGRDFVQVSYWWGGIDQFRGGCARRASGRVECWGYVADHVDVPDCAFIDVDVRDSDNAVGLREDGSVSWFAPPDEWWLDGGWPPGPYASLFANHMDICGVRDDGEAVCWGWSDEAVYSSEVPIIKIQRDWFVHDGAIGWLDEAGNFGPEGWPRRPVRDIAVNGDDVCVIDGEGAIVCQGFYDYGANGEEYAAYGVWLDVDPEGEAWTKLETDGVNVCALDEAGWMTCFSAYPDYVVDVPTEPLVSFSGATEGCGINLTGEIVCWSYNGNVPDSPPER